MRRAAILLTGLALAVYAHALVEPLLAVAGWTPPEPQVECACPASCGCQVAYHGGCGAAGGDHFRLYGTCSCGCSGSGPSEHCVDGRRVAPHLAASPAEPALAAALAVGAPEVVPTLCSAGVPPPDKIPI